MNKDVSCHCLPGLKTVLIDGFRHANPAVSIYFLTHFHADHYDRLDADFSGKLWSAA